MFILVFYYAQKFNRECLLLVIVWYEQIVQYRMFIVVYYEKIK